MPCFLCKESMAPFSSVLWLIILTLAEDIHAVLIPSTIRYNKFRKKKKGTRFLVSGKMGVTTPPFERKKKTMSENIIQLNEEVILIIIGFTIGYRNDYMVLG